MGIFGKSRARIRREAAEWRVRLDGASDAEREAFRRWHDADIRHAEAYARIAAIWDAAAGLPPEEAVKRREILPASMRGPGLALAASLALIAALVAALLLAARGLPGTGGDATKAFATGVGEISSVSLPDGSRLVLDTDSAVQSRYNSLERRLTLRRGRARFQVARGDLPFIVLAGASEVVATGTVFDVSLIDGQTSVLVLEGSVEVRPLTTKLDAPSRAQRLSPGQKLLLKGSGPAERQPGRRGDAVWPTHMLEFDGVALEEAVGMVNRYSRAKLRLGDEKTRRLRISGAYRAGDVPGFARSLSAAFGLRLDAHPDGSLTLSHAKDRMR